MSRLSPTDLGVVVTTDYKRWQTRYKNRFRGMRSDMKRIAQEATSGPYSLQDLAEKGHPYAKAHFETGGATPTQNPTERARIAGIKLSQPAGMVNTQPDGLGFNKNWKWNVKTRFDGEEIEAVLSNPTKTPSGLQLADLLFNGTIFMIARPTLSMILARADPLFRRYAAGVVEDWEGAFR